MLNKNIKLILFSLSIVFLFFVLSAILYAADFTAYAQAGNLNMCSCESRQNMITIMNRGAEPDIFTLKVSADNLETTITSTFSDNKFVLYPGKSKNVTQYINLPCTESKDGKFDVIISSSDVTKTIPIYITSRTCNSISVNNLIVSRNIEQCGKFYVNFTLKNNATFDDSYFISISPFSENIKLSAIDTTLSPNQQIIVSGLFDLDCRIYGNTTFNLGVYSTRTKLKTSVPINLEIKQKNNFNTSLALTRICKNSNSNFNLTIINHNKYLDNYTISSNFEWITPEQNNIIVPSLGKRNINIYVDTENIESKNYPLEISTISQNGLKKIIKTDVVIEDCYGFELTTHKTSYTLDCYNNSFDVNLRNPTKDEATYILNSENINYKSEQNRISVSPYQEKKIRIFGNIDCASTDTETVILSAYNIKNNISLKKITLTINNEDLSRANLIDIIAKDEKVTYIGKNETLEFINNGLYRNKVTLMIDSPDWIFMNQKVFFLEPEQKKVITLAIAPDENTPEGVYPVKIAAKIDDKNLIYTKNIEITLKKRFLFNSLLHFIALFWIMNRIWIIVVGMGIILIILALIYSSHIKKKKEKEIKSKKKYKKSVEFLFENEKTDKFKAFVMLIIIIGAILGIIYLSFLFSSQIREHKNGVENPGKTITYNNGMVESGKIISYEYTGDTLNIPVNLTNDKDTEVKYSVEIFTDIFNYSKSFVIPNKSSLLVQIPFSTNAEFENKNMTIFLTEFDGNIVLQHKVQINVKNNVESSFFRLNNEPVEQIENNLTSTSDATQNGQANKERGFFIKYFPYIFIGVVGLIILSIIFQINRNSILEELERRKQHEQKKHEDENNAKSKDGSTDVENSKTHEPVKTFEKKGKVKKSSKSKKM